MVAWRYYAVLERPYGCGFCTVHIKNGYVIGNLRNTGKLNFLWVCNEIETNFSTKNIDVDFHPVILVNPGSIFPPYSHPNYIIDSNLQYYIPWETFQVISWILVSVCVSWRSTNLTKYT